MNSTADSTICDKLSHADPPCSATAPYPFDKSSADIILRTSDFVDFHVYSQILIAASPFFEGMFDVPQPPPAQQELKSGRPIIVVSEDSKTLETLLRICYPINKQKSRTLEEIEPALRAAMKYEMDLPITVLTDDLEDLIPEESMGVWAVACRLGLEGVARCVASPSNFAPLGDMEGITAANYFRLSEYCRLWPFAPKGPLLSPPPSQASTPPLPSQPTISHQSLAETPLPDLIVRSSDGVEFRAHKAVLSVVSPVLRSKVIEIETSQDTGLNTVGLPILSLDEHSAALLPLLQLCYHTGSESAVKLPAGPSELTAMLVIVDKYEFAAAKSAVWSSWVSVASTNPLSMYCAAIARGYTKWAQEAARHTLSHDLEGVYVAEMEFTPALAYHRLLAYHDACKRVAKDILLRIARPGPGDADGDNTNKEGSMKRHMKKKSASVDSVSIAAVEAPLGPIAFPDSWLGRYLGKLYLSLRLRPGRTAPTVSEMLTEATTGDEKVWCSQCQSVALKILDAHQELAGLPSVLEQVVLQV